MMPHDQAPPTIAFLILILYLAIVGYLEDKALIQRFTKWRDSRKRSTRPSAQLKHTKYK